MERRTELESRESTENRACSRDADFDRYVVPEIPALRRRARGLTGAFHDADDLLQETLMRAYRGIGTFDGRHPRAWLFTIMRHAWINENRKLKPIPVLDPELIGISQPPKASTWGKPEDALAHKIMDPRVEAALDHLPSYHRAVVEAVTLKGLSCRDAADALAIPLGTVLSRLHRARAALREDRRLSPLAQLRTVTAPDLVPPTSRSGNCKGVTP